MRLGQVKKRWVSQLKVFGCIAYALVKTHSRKLNEKFEKCIFVGYYSQSKPYKLYNPISDKSIISRGMVFNEDASWAWSEDKSQQQVQVSEDHDAPPLDPTPTMSGSSTPRSSNPFAPTSNHSSSSSSSSETPPRKFKSMKKIYESCTFSLFILDPTSFEEDANEKEWYKAVEEELLAIQKNHT